ncbi:MAG: hypothetical protein ACOYN6_02505 [Ignavibacteria bacterium]
MNKYLFSLTLLVVSLLIEGCSKDCNLNVDWANSSKSIQSYHNNLLNINNDTSKQSENLDLYLDVTMGLYVAFENSNTKNFFDNLINSLKLSHVNLYELANDKITPTKNAKKEVIFEKTKNPENFKESFSPLEEALNQIVLNNKQALFVSDCELWLPNKGESDFPWAREKVAEWLKMGNAIDFYITDHIDAGKEKHIFYMFFIPLKEVISGKNYTQDFEYFLKNNSVARDLKYTNFSFSSICYSFEQKYKSVKSGGVFQELAMDENTYINNPKNFYEYQEWGLDWKGVIEYIKNAKDDKSGKNIPGGSNLLKDLIFTSKNSEVYDVSELDIKVYDIYDDFEKYYSYGECLKNPPKFKLNDKGEKELDPNNNNLPVILEPGNTCCYDQNGDLIQTYLYKRSEPKEINELFIFDKLRFESTYPKDKSGEIALKIHPNFNGSQISSARDNFFKVDIIIKKCTPNVSGTNLDKFKWEGKEMLINKAMYDGIIMALRDANPEGKVVYTFYIKTPKNNI